MHWSIKLFIVLVVVFNIDVPNSYAAQNDSTAQNSTNINLTNLNAQFETTECALPCKKTSVANKKTTWWMWRTPTQVELRKANANNSEMWEMDENKQLSYQFLLHDEKRVIEYSHTDLTMLGMQTDMAKWQAITQLVTPQDLASMKKVSLKKQYQGLALTQYSGSLNGIKTDITWIDALQIPLSMTYVYPKQQLTVNLTQLNAKPENATTAEQLQTYQQVDYADIGDMEHSATAKIWLSKAHDAPGVHTYGHQH
ncbi:MULTISPECIES: hypothetical protein [Methylotenera]|uniref:hypothetical protein n=1 Tax=Methylotenera TaxID=359407 RepID=UPI00037DBF60|nr:MULTISPECIES: hypothetical protein [Methylotenera]